MEHKFNDEENNVQNLGGKETIADEYLNVFGAVEISNDLIEKNNGARRQKPGFKDGPEDVKFLLVVTPKKFEYCNTKTWYSF